MIFQTSSNGLSPTCQRQGRNQANSNISTALFWYVPLGCSLPPVLVMDNIKRAVKGEGNLSLVTMKCLNFKGGKFSKCRGAAVEVPDFLSKYDPDALRFYLTATLPETRDTELALRAPKGHPGRISSSGTTLS